MPYGKSIPVDSDQIADQFLPEQKDPLLKTKLFVPPIRAKRVNRPGLTEQINDSLDKALILISAPAGFGKTTLLAEWVAQSRLPVAWLSVDEGDNDPNRFLRYVIAALRGALVKREGAVCLSSQAKLQSVQPPPVQTSLVALINDLTDVHEPFVLVLDDYQFITNTRVDEALTFLLEHLPPLMHLIIASRVDPSIPLHRLRAAQRLLEIRSDHLRFTEAETEVFMNRVMELSLPRDDIATLIDRTEGWIVGLQMAALSMQGVVDRSGFVQALSGSHRYILEYLLEEVLNRQPENLQSFLLQTSILDRLCGPLCDAVLAVEYSSQSILESLYRSNLFITPLDEVGFWYRYHHLFANLLQARLLQSNANLVLSLHSRAAEWLKQNGAQVEAMNHAVAAGDIQLAESLVEGRTLGLMDQGEWERLGKWLDSFPVESIFQLPWLCVARAWIMVSTGQVDPAENYLQQAEKCQQRMMDRGQPGESQRLTGYIATLRAYAAILKSEPDPALYFAQEALKNLPRHDLATRTLAARALALPLRFGGDFSAADQVLRQVVDDTMVAGESFSAMIVMGDQVFHQIVWGKLHQAYSISQQALQIAEDYQHQYGSPLPTIAYVYPYLSRVLLEWNDLPGAIYYAESGIELCREWGSFETIATNYTALAIALLASQEIQRALDAIQKAQEAATRLSSWHLEEVRQNKVRILLAGGNKTEAEQWARDKGLKADRLLDLKDTQTGILFARILMSTGQWDAAHLILESILNLCTENKMLPGYAIEVLILHAISLKELGKSDQALQSIEKALNLGEPEGYVRIFVNEGSLMKDLLQGCSKRVGDSLKAYAGKLLLAFSSSPGNQGDSSSLFQPEPRFEALTERERDVLLLLADGLSNREIAERLILSEGTIKTHTHNLYSKLGVESRTRAVARAKELNLLK